MRFLGKVVEQDKSGLFLARCCDMSSEGLRSDVECILLRHGEQSMMDFA